MPFDDDFILAQARANIVLESMSLTAEDDVLMARVLSGELSANEAIQLVING